MNSYCSALQKECLTCVAAQSGHGRTQMNISLPTTQSHSTTERDICITEMLDEVRGMVRNFAIKFALDFDDCHQQAAFIMLKAWPKIPDHVANKKAYLNGCVRRELHQVLRDNIETLSLDVAATQDGETFLNRLQACETGRTEAELDYLDKLTEVVHAVLQECRIEEQEHAKKSYELTTYTPVAPIKPREACRDIKTDKPRRTYSLRKSIKCVFRNHPQVQALIQRETCVL
jgi:hypothetical protein